MKAEKFFKPEINYNCTTAKIAETLGIKLWQAMEMMNYARKSGKLVEQTEDISLCPHCCCMTHTIQNLCGKCKEKKLVEPMSVEGIRRILLENVYWDKKYKIGTNDLSQAIYKAQFEVKK